MQELIVCTPYYLLGIKAVDTKAINTSVALIHITTTRASLLPLFERKDAYCVVSIALHCIALYCLVLPSIHCLALPSMHCLVLLSMRCILISDNTTVDVGCLYICDLSGLHSQGRRNNARRLIVMYTMQTPISIFVNLEKSVQNKLKKKTKLWEKYSL